MMIAHMHWRVHVLMMLTTASGRDVHHRPRARSIVQYIYRPRAPEYVSENTTALPKYPYRPTIAPKAGGETRPVLPAAWEITPAGAETNGSWHAIGSSPTGEGPGVLGGILPLGCVPSGGLPNSTLIRDRYHPTGGQPPSPAGRLHLGGWYRGVTLGNARDKLARRRG